MLTFILAHVTKKKTKNNYQLTCLVFFLFGRPLAHSQVDGSLFRGDGDLFDVLPPLRLEEQLVLLLLLFILFLLHTTNDSIY